MRPDALAGIRHFVEPVVHLVLLQHRVGIFFAVVVIYNQSEFFRACPCSAVNW
jgi:hypothetical protein